MDRQNTWDGNRDVNREDLERAEAELKYERSNPRGFGGVGPAPTAAEIWERAERTKNPYPC